MWTVCSLITVLQLCVIKCSSSSVVFFTKQNSIFVSYGWVNIFYTYPFSLEFESQHARMNAQREYQQAQLLQHKKKLHKIQETIKKEEGIVAEHRKVIT